MKYYELYAIVNTTYWIEKNIDSWYDIIVAPVRN